ncbi:MAG: glycine--tRNA ligase [Candidatus Bathyarchaeota archaeon]|nr:MAG: glycine--tRNA ligase [Candidatus Bathyarchaeota archaeon]
MPNAQDTIAAIAKRRGYYWPSYEIYGGLSGYITYGDLGTKLKRNIECTWRRYFTNHQNILELDAPVINPATVFEASGHLENFKEYSTECTSCGRSFRVDHLIEEKTGLETVEAMGGDAILRLLREKGIKCPQCGGALRDPVMFLTMFKTEIGATGGLTGYARPEAAQSMFINFKRGYQHAREKLPFALAQVGKVMRNEISPRRGPTRVREFTIMELELFFDPQDPNCPMLGEVVDAPIRLHTEEMEAAEENTPLKTTIGAALEQGHILTEWGAYFMGVSRLFVDHLGIPAERQRFRAHLHEERSHYSSQTYDHEVLLDSIGWLEVAGHAYRTDYDLKAHQRGSGHDMTALRDGTRFTPHVVEPSFGLDRLFLAALEISYERRDKRNIFTLPRDIAPYQVSVFPLVTKDGLTERAGQVHEAFQGAGLATFYDEGGSVGRRYARSDEAGTPLAVTVDYTTLEDDTVTVRDRDSWGQVRTPTHDLTEKLKAYLTYGIDFGDLGEPV